LLDQHLTQAEIAKRLGIAEPTVKIHTSTMRLKLGVSRSRHIPIVLKKLGIID
jgi:DNA-binding CsgD family transcriptional regulator